MSPVKIGKIVPGMSDIDVVAEVVEKSEPITVRGEKFATATLKDESGTIRLNLWRA